MKLTYEEKAARILEVLDNGSVPISWHAIVEPDLIRVISQELKKIDKEEENAKENV